SSSKAGVGLFNVATRAPVVALNTYAAPAFVAPVSSPEAPTTTMFPDTATETPKSSPSPGVGLFSVATRAPVVALNTYADPESAAPVSSSVAPTTTVLPATGTETEKSSSKAGVGLFSVATRAPLVALNTYADPVSSAPVSS